MFVVDKELNNVTNHGTSELLELQCKTDSTLFPTTHVSCYRLPAVIDLLSLMEVLFTSYCNGIRSH